MTLVKTNRQAYPTINSLFNDFFGDQISHANVQTKVTKPAINVAESDDGFTIEVAAPGFEKGDFSIKVENHVLSISIKSSDEEQVETKKYVRQEFRSSSFERSFNLPKGQVEEDKIEAQYENGILYVAVPKVDAVKPKPAREISIS